MPQSHKPVKKVVCGKQLIYRVTRKERPEHLLVIYDSALENKDDRAAIYNAIKHGHWRDCAKYAVVRMPNKKFYPLPKLFIAGSDHFDKPWAQKMRQAINENLGI